MCRWLSWWLYQNPISRHNNSAFNDSKVTPPTIQRTHHASEREQCCLDLRHVSVLKQVVGLEGVVRLQTVLCGGFAEVSQVLQLKQDQ